MKNSIVLGVDIDGSEELLTVSLLFVSSALSAQTVGKIMDPVDWINPLIGTSSKPSFSNGNTYPYIFKGRF